ncbi:AAA domain-containing protein [Porticoccaceae bacterium]|nr:AAA domain-containing protein [Porticoccaceae bacterium]
MNQRKYFKHKVTELEEIFKSSKQDFAVLEELEEELHLHRKTQRARTLLENVRSSLHVTSEEICRTNEPAPLTPSEPQIQNTPELSNYQSTPEPVLDWDAIIAGASKHAFEDGRDIYSAPENRPVDILDTWTALEALSPQTYKRPNDLVIPGGSVVYLREGQEPWINGENARPKTQLYYVVYLGYIDLEISTGKLLEVYKDDRIERPSVTGLAAMGAVILNRKGIPVSETGLTISSYGWAYARALHGKLHDLKSWNTAEKVIKTGLEKFIYRKDRDGNLLPFSLTQAEQCYEWLVRNCGIPQEDTAAPEFAIRQYQHYKKGAPETDILNSFYLADLQRARHSVEKGTANKALSAYLGITKPHIKIDLLKDKSHIEKALLPKNMPLGRWPGKGRHSLVLLQQTAINLAVQQLKDGGLFSVNGPPGTGKTTLLRDIIASALVDRAMALHSFEKTDDAFEHAGHIKLGNAFIHLYRLNKTIRGHEILVASTNNKAVENISKELPLRSQVAEDISGLNYFKTISNALSEGEEETWGTIAAVLGNSKNRYTFTQKAWWDDDSGLKAYFRAITGQLYLGIDDNGDEIIPKIVQECDPPSSPEDADLRWSVARKRFAEVINKSATITKCAQNAYEAYGEVQRISKRIQQTKTDYEEQKPAVSKAQHLKEILAKQIDEVKAQQDHAIQEKLRFNKEKPGFFKRIFARMIWKAWKIRYQKLSVELKKNQNLLHGMESKKISICKNHAKQAGILKNLQKSLSDLPTKHQKALDTLKEHEAICGEKLIKQELWDLSHDEQQKFTPNFTDAAQKIRDEVFVASLELHKAFIDASAKQVRQNLAAYFYCLGNGNLPEDKQALLSHLWSTAFLITPVISTAFASVGRMLKKLPQDSIGWLLVDEAGQAIPQAAVGAICRAKRVMSVGDPLQIEPVFPLPASLVEGISGHMGVDPYHWMAPIASVQSLSDNANVYGTAIARDLNEIRIGCPLLVHRRCEDPMFTISNRMAYNGLMVQATQPKYSAVTDCFGAQSKWFHIEGSAQEKWCPEEGEHVVDMLLKAIGEFGAQTDIFVISPFRLVANRMSQRMRQEAQRLSECGIDDPGLWIRDNIGTVHTFQGKEAQAVILLLGAPDPSQNGARSWATSNVNLLNVAVSRAKQNFYVVGNQNLWGDIGYMKIIHRKLM